MGAATRAGTAERGAGRVPWADVVICAVTAVGWALIGMAGTAALGLRLLDADAVGALGPMTAAVVAMAAGGSVTPSADVSAVGPVDVSAVGLPGAEATTALGVTPLGVSLAGALLLALVLLRSLRSAGVGGTVPVAELAARAGAVVVLCAAVAGGLVWAGDDVIIVDGGSLGLGGLPGWGEGGGLPDWGGSGGLPDPGAGGGIDLPGLGGLGEPGGATPDGAADLVGAEVAVGYRVDAVPTVLGAALWGFGVSAVALAASRRTPLPHGWAAVHRVVRPAVSALVTVLLVAVAAGCAAAGYAAVGDDRPRRIVGAALLGAPNGVGLGLPLGLGVPWDARASGALLGVLPHPLDELLHGTSGGSVTLGRLAELDGRVWLLGVASAVAMLLAGVLTAVRTPVVGTPAAFAGHCALRLGAAGAVALPVLVRLTRVSVDASLTVLGFDAFDAGLLLHGDTATALLLGAVWGAVAGGAGALLARAAGAAGTRAAPAPAARGGIGATGGDAGAGVVGSGGVGGARGAGDAGDARGAGNPRGTVVAGGSGQTGRWGPAGPAGWPREAGGSAGSGASGPVGWSGSPRGSGGSADGAGYDGRREAPAADEASTGPGGQGEDREGGVRHGPYTPGTPYRPPNPDTNPYLRMPGAEETGGPHGARPSDGWPAPAEGRAEAQGQAEAHGAWGPPRPEAHDPGAPSWPDAHGAGDPARQARPRDDGDAGAKSFRRPSWVPPPPSGSPRPPGADRTRPDPAEPAPPEGSSGPGDSSSSGDSRSRSNSPGNSGEDDVHGAPTVIRPVEPPRRGPQGGAARRRTPRRPDDGPPPPPPPPPPAPPGSGGRG
ncbi:streptophobe family protein [Streptomyces sp. NPDC029526]|uniref:streptophobe family protein n=1 Tax=Streptomyces sp. NPDC029526 TaxID=3155728 RepID=UPI0033CD2306